MGRHQCTLGTCPPHDYGVLLPLRDSQESIARLADERCLRSRTVEVPLQPHWLKEGKIGGCGPVIPSLLLPTTTASTTLKVFRPSHLLHWDEDDLGVGTTATSTLPEG